MSRRGGQRRAVAVAAAERASGAAGAAASSQDAQTGFTPQYDLTRPVSSAAWLGGFDGREDAVGSIPVGSSCGNHVAQHISALRVRCRIKIFFVPACLFVRGDEVIGSNIGQTNLVVTYSNFRFDF
mmetsp:Transcript_8942/g.19752  ORF Transcript_8942/g.19752 Transcript_8942/m.19752 type:complete len:126 (-) Transcript_8942:4-381(-)